MSKLRIVAIAHVALVTLMALVGVLAAPSPAAAQKVSRETVQQQHEIDAFVKRTASHGKLALLYFTSSHCPPCRLLESQFFPDPAVSRDLGAKYEVLKLDGDKAMAAGIYARYGLTSGYPAFVALGGDGKPLGHYTGAAVEPPKDHGIAIDKRAMLGILLGLAKGNGETATG